MGRLLASELTAPRVHEKGPLQIQRDPNPRGTAVAQATQHPWRLPLRRWYVQTFLVRCSLLRPCEELHALPAASALQVWALRACILTWKILPSQLSSDQPCTQSLHVPMFLLAQRRTETQYQARSSSLDLNEGSNKPPTSSRAPEAGSGAGPHTTSQAGSQMPTASLQTQANFSPFFPFGMFHNPLHLNPRRRDTQLDCSACVCLSLPVSCLLPVLCLLDLARMCSGARGVMQE